MPLLPPSYAAESHQSLILAEPVALVILARCVNDQPARAVQMPLGSGTVAGE